jgi:branched-subunit amino acid ABC-type transport system permease component
VQLASFELIAVSIVVAGLTLGAIFALVASGVTIVYGSIWLPNAASGQFFALAGLLTWSAVTAWHMSPLLAGLFVIVVSIPFSWGLERLLIRRFYDVPDRNVVYFVVTLGITQILTGVFSVTYGRWSDQFSVASSLPGVLMIGDYPIPYARLTALAIAVITVVALFAVLRLHPLGRALRAVFQNRDAAALRGVNVRSIYRFAFILGTLIVFVGGTLYATAYSFDLTVAANMSVTAFAIMIIGGPGSVLGSLVIGLIFGFVQAVVSVVADPTIATFSYLVAMLAILLIKPSGLFVR